MISKKHRCIFIHIHKTGGTSIEKKLGHFDTLTRGVQDHRTLREIEELTRRSLHFRKLLYTIKKGRFATTTHHLKRSFFPELTPSEYKSYYKFSFVRNSWSRMYSWYANVMRDPLHQQALNIEDSNYSFASFLEEKVNPATFSQLYFLKDHKGNIPMDFIGKFENLVDDFARVGNEIGLEDSTLPTLLVGKPSNYKEFYTDQTTDLVYRQYKEEIDYFGFEY